MKITYDYLFASRLRTPNIFDMIAIAIISTIFYLLWWSAASLHAPYKIGQELILEFSFYHLMYYSLRTLMRMLCAMILSILVTFAVGSLMAKNKTYRQILLPLIDILQSIPPLGVNAFIVLTCIHLAPHSTFGLECAAIITTFFAQVWNMILSFYQSLISIPKELDEVCDMYHLSPWQRFWHLEVPQATPGLIMNSMVSMSASWFFIVASESLSISDHKIILPGVGSFIGQSVLDQNLSGILAACLAMFFVILVYDQLLFRPLMTWSEKFKDEIVEDEIYQSSWFFDLLSRASFIHTLIQGIQDIDFMRLIPGRGRGLQKNHLRLKKISWIIQKTVEIAFICLIIKVAFKMGYDIFYHFDIFEILMTIKLGGITSIKVLVMVFLSACIWVPVGVRIGSKPQLAYRFQPVIQFLAACPPQMLYPFFAHLIVDYNLNVDIWTAPIMILGTQWYILFNVIAGTLMITKDQRLVAANFGLKGTLLWRRLYLPAVLPYCITGCMAAAGGCWNVAIDSDTIIWGHHQIQAQGIGSYIHNALSMGDFNRAILGIAVMTFYVLIINRYLWNALFEKVSAYHQ